jgi:predicted nucleic acid-binding protein
VTLVVDASAVAAWLLPDVTGQDLATLTAAHDVFCAPKLRWAEFRNILIVNEHRGAAACGHGRSADPGDRGAGDRDGHRAPSNAGVLALSRKHGLTGYGALYLDRALRRGTVLATLDAKPARGGAGRGSGGDRVGPGPGQNAAKPGPRTSHTVQNPSASQGPKAIAARRSRMPCR